MELTIKRSAFLIGYGLSRLTAINHALLTIKTNQELIGLVSVDVGRRLHLARPEKNRAIKDEIRIIKECAL